MMPDRTAQDDAADPGRLGRPRGPGEVGLAADDTPSKEVIQ